MPGRVLFGIVVLGASALLVWGVFFGTAKPPEPVNLTQEQTLAEDPYPLRDWNVEKPGNLNISVYTFNDRNRNGQYDVGDMPMASVVVDLIAPDDKEKRVRSNINGYANFKMSLSEPEQAVTLPRETYHFQVQPPPMWQVSSGNTRQSIKFVAKAGSVAGLVAEEAPQWVGLMPQLSIAGTFSAAKGMPLPSDLQVTATDPQGQKQTVEFEDSRWKIAASSGRWSIRMHSALDDWAVERSVDVSSAPVELAPIMVGEERSAALPITVVENFDWLQRSTIEKIPNGHGGLDWDYLLAVNNQQYGGPGYVNGLISGHAVAYNSSGHPVTLSAPAGEVFDFVGAYFTVAWPKSHGELLDVVAWRNGQEVSRQALMLSYLGPVYLDADMRGIDKLSISTRHYWQFVVDDLQYRLASAP